MARLNRYERKLYYKYNHPCHNSDGGSDAHRYESAASRNLNRVLNTKWKDDDFDKHYSNPRKGWGRGYTGYFCSWKNKFSFLKNKVKPYVTNPLREWSYRRHVNRDYYCYDYHWEKSYNPKLLPQNKKLWIKWISKFIEIQRASWPVIQKLPEPNLLNFPPCKYDIEVWYDKYSVHSESSKIFHYLFYYFSETFWESSNLRYKSHTKEREQLFNYVNTYKEVMIVRSERFALTTNKAQTLIEVPYQIVPSKTQLFVEGTFFYYSYNNTKLSRYFSFNSYMHWNWALGSQKTTLKYGNDRHHSEIFNDLILSSIQDTTILYNFNLGYNSEIYFSIKYVNNSFLHKLNKKNIITYKDKSFTFEEVLETRWSCFEK